ncbi:hypothetical protein [Flavobacterium sp. KACC 22761]|uniref:hypothetical protein n=1 Tax=Flavobacterium sp. KACC 22761 TaxID=3092665 RepID=UPI002A74C49A|nr:hypothetical protein [Flavobacterium sp. KACC 22761]WPO78242.1 hypothetical protein SCB73_18425 [Flavobacterium sp. KACC 22761]
MKKRYSVLFYNISFWFNYNLRKCNKFSILNICHILLLIGYYNIYAQNNSDYRSNKIALQNAAIKTTSKDFLLIQNEVTYISIISIVLILFALAIVVKFLLLPEINFEEEQRDTHSGFFKKLKEMFKKTQFVLSLIVLIFYFVFKVLAGNLSKIFVKRIGTYGDDIDFYQELILCTMTAMAVGCILGIALIPKYTSLTGFLKLSCLLGILLIVTILFISPSTMIILPGIPELPLITVLVSLMGFVNALCWPVIWLIVFQDFTDLQ